MTNKFNEEDHRYLLELWRKSLTKFCFFNNSNCSEKIIKAHSVQNNRILNRISKDGYVSCFDTRSSKPDSFGNIVKTGRKIASTFSGLCGFHDKVVFQPIEDVDYNGDKKQQFVFAFRAFIKEYYEKISIESYIIQHVNYVKTRFEEMLGPDFIQKLDTCDKLLLKNLLSCLIGTRNVLSRLNSEKIAFLNNYKNQRFDRIRTTVRVIPVEKPLAVCSIFYLKYDLKGNSINDPSYIKENCQPIFLNIFPQYGQTIIMFGCYSKSSKMYENFFEQIRRLHDQDVFPFISKLITLYCENIFLNPDYWDSIGEQNQIAFLKSFHDIRYNNIGPDTLINVKSFIN